MEWVLLALFGAAIWIWLDGLGYREQALAIARHTCQEAGVQLLDDTVALRRLSLAREPGGGPVRIRRVFGFEFSDTGDNRRRGQVGFLGKRREALWLDGTLMNG
jgi:hypothetical protein